MRTLLDARLPGGQPVPAASAPGLFQRWKALETIWNREDPSARKVRLEYRDDFEQPHPDRRWYFRVWVNGRPIREPLPYGVATDPAREAELTAFVARARASLDVPRRARDFSDLRDLSGPRLPAASGDLAGAFARRRLVPLLEQRAADEARDAARVEALAGRLPYPQLAEKLRVVAAREREHAQTLAGLVRDLGGDVPPPEPVSADLGWPDLLRLLRDEPLDANAFRELRTLARDLPEVARAISRVAAEEAESRRDLLDVLTRVSLPGRR